MYGKPEDVPGACNAHLYIADDFGDNESTLRCQREAGHDGPHREQFERGDRPVIVEWWVNEREESPAHE